MIEKKLSRFFQSSLLQQNVYSYRSGVANAPQINWRTILEHAIVVFIIHVARSGKPFIHKSKNKKGSNIGTDNYRSISIAFVPCGLRNSATIIRSDL